MAHLLSQHRRDSSLKYSPFHNIYLIVSLVDVPTIPLSAVVALFIPSDLKHCL
jgi:hypothetical protein